MHKNEVIVVIATLVLVTYVSALSLLGAVTSPFQTSTKVLNSGNIKVIGPLGVYSDPGCTTKVTSIDWGMIDPGSNKTFTCYIKNEGNSAITLSMNTSNWNPPTASEYMTLTWDYDGSFVNPSGVVRTTFTLAVSSSITGVTSFSFDITIIGTG